MRSFQALRVLWASGIILALSACNEPSPLLPKPVPQAPVTTPAASPPGGVRPDPAPLPEDPPTPDPAAPELPDPAEDSAEEPATDEEAEPIIEIQAPGFRGDSELYGRTQVAEQENDGEERTVAFRVLRFPKHLSTAQRVARYLWAAWWPHKTLADPFPCGVSYSGRIQGKATSRDGWAVYVFHGAGDGWKDSCTGTRGKIGWQTHLEIRYDAKSRRGFVTYYSSN
jgi:hypothetical protein